MTEPESVASGMNSKIGDQRSYSFEIDISGLFGGWFFLSVVAAAIAYVQ